MKWHKVIFSADQITGDEYDRLPNEIRDTIFQDPLRFQNVAIFAAKADVITKHDSWLTKTAYFTPDAVEYFWPLLEPYSPELCERPRCQMFQRR